MVGWETELDADEHLSVWTMLVAGLGWAGLGWAGWAEPGTGNCCYHSNCLLQLGTMDTGIVLCLILQLVNTGSAVSHRTTLS